MTENYADSERKRIISWLDLRRPVFLKTYQQLSAEQDTTQLKNEIASLVTNLSKAGIYPNTPPQLNTKKYSWLVEEAEQEVVVTKRCEDSKQYYWVINYADGHIYKAHLYDRGILMDDPARMTKEAPAVMDCFFSRLIQENAN